MVKDVQSVVASLRKFGADLGLPTLDIDQLVETQRKNIDALGEAAQVAVGASESLVARQREILEAGLKSAAELARNYKPSGTPQEALAKQTEFAKSAFDITVQNARDVSGIASKSTSEVVGIIRDRLEATLGEIRSAVNAPAAPSGGKPNK